MSIRFSFESWFSRAGFEVADAAPVFPSPDSTTLYTSATISTFKSLLGFNVPKICIVQPCLRVQNLRHVYEAAYDPSYLSHFTMLGTLSSPDAFEPLEILGWLATYPRLLDRVIVRTSRLLRWQPFENQQDVVGHIFDDHDPKYYQWSYGECGLTGEGVTLAIRDHVGIYHDVGNVIRIFKDEIPVAVEFCVGEETFASRLEASSSPFVHSDLYMSLGLSLEAKSKRLGDAIVIAYVLFLHGVSPNTRGAEYVMRKALRSVAYLLLAEGQSATQIALVLGRRLSFDPMWLRCISKECAAVEENHRVFMEKITEASGKFGTERLAQEIHNLRERYGVPHMCFKSSLLC